MTDETLTFKISNDKDKVNGRRQGHNQNQEVIVMD